MCEEKCRRPCLYTRSKSACFSSRAARGKPDPAVVAGCSTLRFGASALTSSQSCTISSNNDGLCCPLWGTNRGNPAPLKHACALWPAARQHCRPPLRLHASPEPVLLRALALVGLKCTFRHRKSLLLIESDGLRQTASINDADSPRQTRVLATMTLIHYPLTLIRGQS